MLMKILRAVVFLLAVFLVWIALKSSSYEVVRTATIQAPPDRVFPLINDFHNWDRWSPWAKLDPNMKVTYDGPPQGTGAGYSWTGNDKAGSGNMKIESSHPNDAVAIRLEFVKPFPSVAQTQFNLAGAGNSTTITWKMAGENNYVGRLVTTLMGGIDRMVGPDFERGLQQLKTAAESSNF